MVSPSPGHDLHQEENLFLSSPAGAAKQHEATAKTHQVIKAQPALDTVMELQQGAHQRLATAPVWGLGIG